ncbi:MAG: hypothetical protein KA508_00335 [Gammaproteobacteria bacterium]|nr:hypothetical protein [Gammaproteobacteria bacterium]
MLTVISQDNNSISNLLDKAHIELETSKKIPEKCSQFSFEVLLFCVYLLKKIGDKEHSKSDFLNPASETLSFIYHIGLILDILYTKKSFNLETAVNKFILVATSKNWFEKYSAPECKMVSSENLLLWLSSVSKLKSVVHFIDNTKLTSYIHSLLQRIILKTEDFEIFISDLKLEFNEDPSYTKDFFIPNLFLVVNTSHHYGFHFLYRFINFILRFQLNISGQAERYVKLLNSALMDELEDIELGKIFAALNLNAYIMPVRLLSQKDKSKILDRIVTLDLDPKMIRMLWKFQWDIFRDMPDEDCSKLDRFLKKFQEALQGIGCEWEQFIAKTIFSENDLYRSDIPVPLQDANSGECRM